MTTSVGSGLSVDGVIKARQATQAGEVVVLGEDGKVPASLLPLSSSGSGSSWLGNGIGAFKVRPIISDVTAIGTDTDGIFTAEGSSGTSVHSYTMDATGNVDGTGVEASALAVYPDGTIGLPLPVVDTGFIRSMSSSNRYLYNVDVEALEDALCNVFTVLGMYEFESVTLECTLGCSATENSSSLTPVQFTMVLDESGFHDVSWVTACPSTMWSASKDEDLVCGIIAAEMTDLVPIGGGVSDLLTCCLPMGVAA